MRGPASFWPVFQGRKLTPSCVLFPGFPAYFLGPFLSLFYLRNKCKILGNFDVRRGAVQIVAYLKLFFFQKIFKMFSEPLKFDPLGWLLRKWFLFSWIFEIKNQRLNVYVDRAIFPILSSKRCKDLLPSDPSYRVEKSPTLVCCSLRSQPNF